MADVIVVGGGLAGLVAARHLAARGENVTLLERRSTLGGRVRSECVDGFTLDRGFQVLFTAYPAVQRELNLDALDLGAFRPGATVALDDSRSGVADPLGDPGGLLGTLFSDALTLGDAWRLFRLRQELASTPPEDLLRPADTTIREYLRERGFSARFVERFAAPFYGGIPLDRSLSTSSAIFRYTFTMLAAGRIAIPAEGMGAIPAQLARAAEAAGAQLEVGREVESVGPDGDGSGNGSGNESGNENLSGVTVETQGETLAADAVVVATDPASARALTGVDTIPRASRGCVTQHFALPSTQRLHVRHPLILNAAPTGPNQVAIVSDATPALAPDGRQLLSATFLDSTASGDEEEDTGGEGSATEPRGGAPAPEDAKPAVEHAKPAPDEHAEPALDAEALAEQVRETLAGWFPENRFADLELLRTHRIDHAQHVQPPGVLATRPAVDAPVGPVYLAGDFTRWASIQGALESGQRAAAAVESSP